MSQVFEWRAAPKAEYAVIGDPVEHSLSPRMHAAAFAACGIPARYVAIWAPRGEVGLALDHLRALGYAGANATVPHKEEALEWCTERESFAQRARAANTLRLLDRAGRNTDGPGFLAAIAGRYHAGAGDVLLLGAGGTARALGLALVGKDARVRVWNRTTARAEELLRVLGPRAQLVERPDPVGAGLVLNATSASLRGEELPIDWRRAEPGAIACDAAYAEGPTPFVAAAARAGLATMDGRALLVRQGALAFEWWTGRAAPLEAMEAAIR